MAVREVSRPMVIALITITVMMKRWKVSDSMIDSSFCMPAKGGREWLSSGFYQQEGARIQGVAVGNASCSAGLPPTTHTPPRGACRCWKLAARRGPADNAVSALTDDQRQDMSLDYSTLDLLRQNHPAWRLLRSDHAPLVASFLQRVFIAPNLRVISSSHPCRV